MFPLPSISNESLVPKYSAWPATNSIRSNVQASIARAQKNKLEPHAPATPPSGSCRPTFLTHIESRMTSKFIALELTQCDEDEKKLLRCAVSRDVLTQFAKHFKTYEPLLSTCVTHFDNLVERFNVFRNSHTELNDEVMSWRTKYSALQEEHQEALQKHDAELGKIKRRLEDRRRENLITQLNDLRQEIASKNESLEDMSTRNVKYIRAIADFEEKLVSMTNERDALKRELNESRNQSEGELQRCLNVLRDFELYRAKCETMFVEKDSNMAVAGEKINELQFEIRGLNDHVKILETRSRRLNLELKRTSSRTKEPSMTLSPSSDGRLTPRPSWDLLNSLDEEEALLEDDENNFIHISTCSTKVKVNWMFDKWRDSVSACKRLQIALEDRERLLRFMDEETRRAAPKHAAADKVQKVFQGKGTASNVPVHLRWAGQARNRIFPKREIEMQIREIWRYYEAWSLKNVNRSFSECFMAWLRSKYGNQLQAIMDHSYSFVDAIKRFEEDADCSLMQAVLDGTVPHYSAKDQANLVIRSQQWMEALDKEQDPGRISGKLSKKKLFAKLGEFFTWYTEEMLEKTKIAIHTDQPSNVVEYNKLFINDEHFNESHYVERIRDYYLDQGIAFIENMQKIIQQSGTSDGMISYDAAVAALVKMDPNRDDVVFRTFLLQCYQPKGDATLGDFSVEVDWLMLRFRDVFISHIPVPKQQIATDMMTSKSFLSKSTMLKSMSAT